MKLNRPNKFNKTRHSNQEGTKTALAFWKFPKNRYRTEKHPVIISKVKCSSKVETILSFQEKQMLEGLVNAVQTSQRDAIRIALYELSKTSLEASLRLLKYASKESQEKGHTSRSSKVTAKLPKAEKVVFDELQTNCKLTSKETVRLAIIWLAMSVKDEDFKLTKSPRVSQKKLAREWSKTYDKEKGSKLTALSEAADAAYEKAKEEAEERREEEYKRRGETLELMKKDGSLAMWAALQDADQSWQLDPQIIDEYEASLNSESFEKWIIGLEELSEREKEIERIKASFPPGTEDDQLANDIYEDNLREAKAEREEEEFLDSCTDEELIDHSPDLFFMNRPELNGIFFYDDVISFKTDKEYKRRDGETADEYFNRAFPLNVLENIKKKQEENAAQAKERMAELNKKFQKTAKKYGLDLSREERIMKQEERARDSIKQSLKSAEEKKRHEDIERLKAELDSRLRMTNKEIIEWWNEHHPDMR